MKEKSEIKDDGEDNREKQSGGKSLTRSILGLVLLFLVASAFFLIVNNRLSAVSITGDGTAAENWPTTAGTCCSPGGTATAEEQLAQSGLAYYRANYGGTEGLEATVDDFGCHQEVSILRGSEEIRRFGYINGNFFDITP